jgi:hypothetical protein
VHSLFSYADSLLYELMVANLFRQYLKD